ncbi:MAG: hydroxymethylglutaryl-CoA reductase, degradative [Bdellovibrionales bacterium]|nr:hydroxymethylglutaryl-CoA reductase, degradative [Bdellovibrionales bacterium]
MSGYNLDGFSKLSRSKRFEKLLELGCLTKKDVKLLQGPYPIPVELAENFIENVIGYFPMPFGVATHFVIDNKDYIIPMVVEETSIIAAASKTAKWIKNNGTIITESLGSLSIGQIQIADVKDFNNLKNILEKNKLDLINQANLKVANGLVARGGGVINLEIKKLDNMAIIHVLVDTCEAMGANIINQVCEFLKKPIEQLSLEKVSICILTNLVDTKLVKAKVTLKNLDPNLCLKIEQASRFAEKDPYRAATNNKGVLNGIDPILLATGNDWRAVEAGVHSYASANGKYSSITKWRSKNSGTLVGTLIAPIVVGTVGGVTKLHPMAKMSLQILKISSSKELSKVCAAAGLVQNLGALKALTTEGIIEGHMKLHIKNLVMSINEEEKLNNKESELLSSGLENLLIKTKRVSLQHAKTILTEIRYK